MRLQPSRLALMVAAATTLSAAAVFAAVAQDGPPPSDSLPSGPPPSGPPPMAEDGPGGPGGPPPMFHHRFDPEARARRLRDVLQLRADQDGALKAYLEATGPKDWGKNRPKTAPADGPPEALTTPERLDREVEHLAHARARIDATRAFYAALSPGQKKAFDALGPLDGGDGPMARRVEFRHFKGGPGGMPAQPAAN